MIRSVVLWLVHFYADKPAVDGEHPMPPWLERWVARDPALTAYVARLRHMESQLRRTAATIVPGSAATEAEKVQRATPVRAMTQPPKQVLFYLATIAACLAMIVVGGVAIRNGIERSPTVPAPLAEQRPPVGGNAKAKDSKAWAGKVLQARAWAARAIREHHDVPGKALEKLDQRLDRDLVALRRQADDATRYFAITVPVASLKMLGAGSR